MKKIIFLLLVFAVSSPVLAMNWDEGFMRGWDESARNRERYERQDRRLKGNKALGELNLMVSRILSGPNFPGETTGQRRRAAGTAAMKELSTNPDLLSLPPEIYTQHLEVFQRMAATPD